MPTAEVELEQKNQVLEVLEAEGWILAALYHPPSNPDYETDPEEVKALWDALWSKHRKSYTGVDKHGETIFEPTWVRELWNGDNLEATQWLDAKLNDKGQPEWTVMGLIDLTGDRNETFPTSEQARRHADIQAGGFSTVRPPGR